MAAGHNERTHSLCSASSASRWLACPGSLKLSRALPVEPPSKYAAEGTRAHELAERILLRWLEAKRVLPHDWIDSLRPEYRDTEEGGWSMVDYVMSFVNYCVERVSELEKPSVKPEVRLVLDPEKNLFGTVDLCATGMSDGAEEGFVADLKYGRGVAVSAKDNPQLAYYAAALKNTSRKNLKRFRVAIVQPRLDPWYSEAVMTREEVEDWERVLKAGADKALRQAFVGDSLELKAGSHCRFCPALKGCKTHETYLAEVAGLDFDDTHALSTLVLTPERVARILSAKEQVRRFLDAAEGYALELLMEGKEVPGFKVVEGRTRRVWKHGEELTAEQLVMKGVKDPYEKKLKGITAVERELGRGRVDDLTEKPKGAPAVVPAHDEREDWIKGIGEEFNE